MSDWLYQSPEEKDRARAEQDLLSHKFFRVLDTLNEEQTESVRNLLLIIRESGSKATTVANFYVGLLYHKAERDFGLCMACLKKHADELGLEQQSDGDA